MSKVLRHKEQHLKRGGYDNSTGSKKKGKAPDVELTLANYVRRRLARGVEVTDELIIENGKLFAKTGENQHKYTDDYFSPAWLQHFKSLYMHPNGSMGRLMRRASDTSIPDRMHMSTPRIRQRRRSGGAAAAEAIVSPLSPHAGHMSPLSEADGVKEEAVAPEGLGLDFTYQTTASHSATSLTNDVSFSPTGAFTFSPDPNSGGPFSMGQQHMPFGAAAPHPDMMHHQRDKRSNTYPSLNMEAVNGLGGDPATPRHLSSASTLDSHSPLYAQRPFSIDTSASTLTSPPALHRSGSNSSLTGRTPVDVSPVSPSHEDARRAASTLLSYIQHMSAHGQFEHNEYLILVQLTKKLQVHQLQHQPSRSMSVGGLSRIPEGDGEMMMNPHSCAMAPTEPQG